MGGEGASAIDAYYNLLVHTAAELTLTTATELIKCDGLLVQQSCCVSMSRQELCAWECKDTSDMSSDCIISSACSATTPIETTMPTLLKQCYHQAIASPNRQRKGYRQR